MKKFKTYGNETLHDVTVSRKIDGVRAHNTEQGILSRKDKPLYNIEMNCDVAEIFVKSWEDTVSLVRTRSEMPFDPSYVYELLPNLDSRLYLGTYEVLSPSMVSDLFDKVVEEGYEGLVLETTKWLYKVKSVENYDVPILGIVEGTGKYKGKLGAFVTERGKVGTGFSDEEREKFFTPTIIGETIEVKAMGLTPDGKFRHPRYHRMRFDK